MIVMKGKDERNASLAFQALMQPGGLGGSLHETVLADHLNPIK